MKQAVLRSDGPPTLPALFTCSLLALVVPLLSAQQFVPQRVAIVQFTLGQQATQVAHQSLGIQGDIGVDLRDQLMTKLGQSGKVELIERERLQQIIKEQNITISEGFDSADAAKLGKLAGAKSVLIGSVSNLSGGVHTSLTSATCKILHIPCFDQTKGEVALTVSVRVVDVETGKVLTTATGEGKAAETKTVPAGTKDVSYGNGLLQTATTQAFDSLVRQLEASPALAPFPAARVAPPPPAVRTAYDGEILDITGDQITFEAGSKQGVQVGDTVKIVRSGKTLRNSKGEVVKIVTDSIGTAKISDVDEKTSTATFTAVGTAKPTKSDKAVFKP